MLFAVKASRFAIALFCAGLCFWAAGVVRADGPSPVLLYRPAPSPMGDNNAVSLWLYSDGAPGTAHVRVMATAGRAAGASAWVRGAGEDTEPLWPAWISATIPLDFSGWKRVVLTRDQLTYRPPVGTVAGTPASASPSDADAVGIDVARKSGVVCVDDIAWVHTDASGNPTGDETSVDNFEQGNVAAWTAHGTPEAAQSVVFGVTGQPGLVKEGREAFKLDFSQTASLRAAGEHQLAQAMALTHTSYAVYVPNSPFERELPNSVPGPGEIKHSMYAFACDGQTQPVSFCVYSKQPLTDVTVAPKTDLLGIGHKIDRSAIDIRVVKVWNREGIGPLIDPDAAGPTPELLLKDDRQPLEMSGGTPPDVRLTGYPVTDIPAGTEKQFWVDVTIPDNTPSDTYSTELLVTGTGMKPAVVSLSVHVLPIHLMDASKQYAIGFRGKLGTPPSAAVSPVDYVSRDQFSAELADIAAHGFRYATLTDSQPALWDAVSIYQQAGLATPVVYDGLNGLDDEDTIKSIEQDRTANHAPAFDYVVPSCATQAQETAWAKNDGVECAGFIPDDDTLNQLEGNLDLAIYSADEPYAQKLLQTDGRRQYMDRDWWRWPSAQVDPQVDRLYTGYLLWRTDLYGAFASDYQTCWGTDPFDDTDPGAPADKAMYQPAMMAYPAANGVIDTVQWEAAREGVTDVRYLTTFYAALRECKDNHLDKDLVQTAQDQVTGFLNKAFWTLTDADYQAERTTIAHYAVILRQAVDGYYKKQGLPVY